MKRRIQNKIAESKLTLPAMLIYAAGIWLTCGLVQHQWWLQLVCFGLSVFFMILLNNICALIRIYSRMVSCSFIALTCCACFLFSSVPHAIVQICFLGYLLFIFLTYQDKQAAGLTYYAYLSIGFASIFFVKILWFVPLLWLLMATELQSLSWRTWTASLFGLLTPYWFGACLMVWTNSYPLFVRHVTSLIDFHIPSQTNALNTSQIAVLILIAFVAIIGFVHFFRKQYQEKIRIRLLYGFLFWMDLATALFLFIQPQHYDPLIRIMIILTAPPIAHFLTLTSTKITNIMFFVIVSFTLIITSYNLWTLL